MNTSEIAFVSDDPAIQARYLELRQAGLEHDDAFVKTAFEASQSLPWAEGCDYVMFHVRDRCAHQKVSDDFEQQARYWRMRRDGQSHKMAEMLACRAFPGLNGTDKAFNRGRHNGKQFERCPALGNYFKSIADRAGVSVTGRHYCYGLGRFPGDPRAWVQDTSDVLRIARERKLNVEGIVNYQAEPVEPSPDVSLAPDIWHRETQAILQEDPDMRYLDAREKAFNLRTGANKDRDELLVEDYVPHPADVLAADE